MPHVVLLLLLTCSSFVRPLKINFDQQVQVRPPTYTPWLSQQLFVWPLLLEGPASISLSLTCTEPVVVKYVTAYTSSQYYRMTLSQDVNAGSLRRYQLSTASLTTDIDMHLDLSSQADYIYLVIWVPFSDFTDAIVLQRLSYGP